MIKILITKPTKITVSRDNQIKVNGSFKVKQGRKKTRGFKVLRDDTGLFKIPDVRYVK